MAENRISEKAQQFLADNIHSVEQLEIFLTLAEEPAQFWSTQKIFQKIQSSENSIAHCLQDFAKNGLVVAGEGGTYKMSPAVVQLASELRIAYRERRVTVIELIYSKPSGEIQSFADAFRLRKDK